VKKRKLDNLKAVKARRQKMMLLGLGAVLAVLVAVQAPRLLKKSHNSTPAATPAATTPTGTPSAGAAAAVAVTTTSTQLPESDVPPPRSKAQLFSFERFRSKDPFVQQVADTATPGSPYPGAAPTPATGAPSSSTSTGAPAPRAQTATPQTTVTAGGPSTQKTTAAVIEVNRQRQTVQLTHDFPSGSPTFKLVSVRGRVAQIGIAGGSFASGDQTVALQLGKTVTLMNTTDGQRYELRLVSVR
jgi:hypothetical protein